MTWHEFLQYASSPGIAAIVGALLSVIVEYVPRFEALGPKAKRASIFILSLAVPLLASFLGVLTDSWESSWDATYWPAIVAGFTAYTTSQVVHIRSLAT